MAKKAAKKSEKVEPKAGLDIKVKMEKDADQVKGRIKVTVILVQDGEEIASDYDFVQV